MKGDESGSSLQTTKFIHNSAKSMVWSRRIVPRDAERRESVHPDGADSLGRQRFPDAEVRWLTALAVADAALGVCPQESRSRAHYGAQVYTAQGTAWRHGLDQRGLDPGSFPVLHSHCAKASDSRPLRSPPAQGASEARQH